MWNQRRRSNLTKNEYSTKVQNPAPTILKGCEFWIWDEDVHKKLFDSTNGKCCFWHIVGLPEKEHLIGQTATGKYIIEHRYHGLKEYEKEWFDAMLESYYLWVKKAPGMGATTFFLGFMVWLAVKDDKWNNATMGIVTGPRINIAIEEIQRIPLLFKNIDYRPRSFGPVIIIDGVRIEAFPSHTFDTARGIEKVRFWFLDEGDFFPKTQQLKARQIVERYIGKSHPYIIFNSTAGLPGGLYETMENEKDSMYTKVFSLVDKGIRDGIYTAFEIEEARKAPSFPSEYEGQYGVGLGNIFNYKLVERSISKHLLEPQGGPRLLVTDPAFGSQETSSKAGILGLEKRDDVIYTTYEEEVERGDEATFIEHFASIFDAGGYHTALCDSAYPGLIRSWRNGAPGRPAISVMPVIFAKNIQRMVTNAVTKIADDKFRIHFTHTKVAQQLKAVEYTDDGKQKPDKKKLTFDLGDCVLMGLDYWSYKPSVRKLRGKF